jgi:hypothetical protein
MHIESPTRYTGQKQVSVYAIANNNGRRAEMAEEENTPDMAFAGEQRLSHVAPRAGEMMTAVERANGKGSPTRGGRPQRGRS